MKPRPRIGIPSLRCIKAPTTVVCTLLDLCYQASLSDTSSVQAESAKKLALLAFRSGMMMQRHFKAILLHSNILVLQRRLLGEKSI
jgi:hypothetical protein